MNKAIKLIAFMAAIIEAGIAVIILVLKLNYYINRFEIGWFNTFGNEVADTVSGVVWTTVSILLSLMPSMALLIPTIMIIAGKNRREVYLIGTVGSISFWVLNMIFEFVSIIGATMSLSDSWMSLAIQMLFCHGAMILPGLLNCALIISIEVNNEKPKM